MVFHSSVNVGLKKIDLFIINKTIMSNIFTFGLSKECIENDRPNEEARKEFVKCIRYKCNHTFEEYELKFTDFDTSNLKDCKRTFHMIPFLRKNLAHDGWKVSQSDHRVLIGLLNFLIDRQHTLYKSE